MAIAGTAAASAQVDPYTDDSVPVPPAVGAPSISINVQTATIGDRVRVQGCFFVPDTFIRLTFNPGDQPTNGAPCAGSENALGPAQSAQLASAGGIRQVLRFEQLAQTSPTTARCPYNRPVDAAPPDTTAGGGIGSTRAQGDGCVDVYVTVPQVDPGSYELCAVPVGQNAACAVIKIVSNSSELGRGFARTGLMLLPWVLGAIAAIAVGRYLATRSRPAQD